MLLKENLNEINLETNYFDLNSFGKDAHHADSINWGIWGKEKYTYNETMLRHKFQKEKKILLNCMHLQSERLQYALNFTYGLCDLDGYARPLSKEEFNMLSDIYSEAIQYSQEIKDAGLRFLVQELYCIRKVCDNNPSFKKGELVNESNSPDQHRQYAYLDFFKFSMINLLARVDEEEIMNFSSSQMASLLVLSYFLGAGSFIEKSSLYFGEEHFEGIIHVCKNIRKEIEESLELPHYNHYRFIGNYNKLLSHISQQKQSVKREELFSKRERHRYQFLELTNAYYNDYYHCTPHPISVKDPLTELAKLYKWVSKNHKNPMDVTLVKSTLRFFRQLIDKKYSEDRSKFAKKILIKDFFKTTTHPYFSALQYETLILSNLYKKEFSKHPSCNIVASILAELAPFYSLKYKGSGPLIHLTHHILPENLPRLVLAHHIHNANCDKIQDMMAINKLVEWPVNKLIFNLSSSSSRHAIVERERELCLELGFNYYRIHARQHLKAGNQNKSIFNAINCSGPEYYLTLDDDYFIFPDFAINGHKAIVKNNLDYFQAPLAFKGVYKINAPNGERADAEMMHYFECTSGGNIPRTYVFPRGTGTMFAFKDGISSISDTGGFLIDFSSEDFGQGFLSYLQDNNIKGKKTFKDCHGMMDTEVSCIGEGVDLSGKIMQMIRWCQGTSKTYFYLFFPALMLSLMKGKTDVFFKWQTVRLLTFIPVVITSKISSLIVFFIPFVLCILDLYGLFPKFNTSYYQENLVMVSVSTLFFLLSIIHYCIIQKKISFSPFRILLMDNMILMSASMGYLKGIFRFNSGWSANKSRRIKWGQYSGIIFIVIVNIFSAILSFSLSKHTIGIWSVLNILLFTGSFLYLNGIHPHAKSHIPLPGKTFTKIFQMLSVLIIALFAMYLWMVISKIEGLFLWLYFSYIFLCIFSVLSTLAITCIYSFKEPSFSRK